MENYFFYYVITYLDEVNSENRIVNGLTFGSTFSEAIENLTSYYGDNNIVDIKFFTTVAEGGSCLEMQDFFEFEQEIRKGKNNEEVAKEEK